MQMAKHDGVRCAGRSHGKDDVWKQHAALKCLSRSTRMPRMLVTDVVLPTENKHGESGLVLYSQVLELEPWYGRMRDLRGSKHGCDLAILGMSSFGLSGLVGTEG